MTEKCALGAVLAIFTALMIPGIYLFALCLFGLTEDQSLVYTLEWWASLYCSATVMGAWFLLARAVLEYAEKGEKEDALRGLCESGTTCEGCQKQKNGCEPQTKRGID